MQAPVIFEGPQLTLFLFEEYRVRIINDRGEEALIPLADFHGFLAHLTPYTASLHLPVSVSQWLVIYLSHLNQHV